ncbi:Uncharacterised protein [Vibrio cholerae]|nr:Uncharacterised protein [Vibrio cholerae]
MRSMQRSRLKLKIPGLAFRKRNKKKSLPCIIRSSQAKITYMRWALASA